MLLLLLSWLLGRWAGRLGPSSSSRKGRCASSSLCWWRHSPESPSSAGSGYWLGESPGIDRSPSSAKPGLIYFLSDNILCVAKCLEPSLAPPAKSQREPGVRCTQQMCREAAGAEPRSVSGEGLGGHESVCSPVPGSRCRSQAWSQCPAPHHLRAGTGCSASVGKSRDLGQFPAPVPGMLRAGETLGWWEQLGPRQSSLQPFKVENVFISGISGFRQEGRQLPRFLLDPSERNLESPVLVVFPRAWQRLRSIFTFDWERGAGGFGIQHRHVRGDGVSNRLPCCLPGRRHQEGSGLGKHGEGLGSS